MYLLFITAILVCFLIKENGEYFMRADRQAYFIMSSIVAFFTALTSVWISREMRTGQCGWANTLFLLNIAILLVSFYVGISSIELKYNALILLCVGIYPYVLIPNIKYFFKLKYKKSISSIEKKPHTKSNIIAQKLEFDVN